MATSIVKGKKRRSAVILTGGLFKSDRAKTAHGLIRHGKRYRIVAVIDPPLAGQDAGRLLGLKQRIPIVRTVAQVPRAEFFILGVAPPGGRLPNGWRKDVRAALSRGMNVVSGLHDFLGKDLEFTRLANRFHVAIWDVRRPPANLQIAAGKLKPRVPVVLTVGTGPAIGKRTSSLCLVRLAEKKGIDVGFLATGQTGIMIGCDEGVVADRLPSDFLSGEIEKRVKWLMDRGKKLIVVEGNGSMGHPAYAPVALGILIGSHATHIIMCHDPTKKKGRSLRADFSPIETEMDKISMFSNAKLMGIALRTKNAPHWKTVIKEYRKKFNVPVVDPIRQSSSMFLKAVGLWKAPEIGSVKGSFKQP